VEGLLKREHHLTAASTLSLRVIEDHLGQLDQQYRVELVAGLSDFRPWLCRAS